MQPRQGRRVREPVVLAQEIPAASIVVVPPRHDIEVGRLEHREAVIVPVPTTPVVQGVQPRTDDAIRPRLARRDVVRVRVRIHPADEAVRRREDDVGRYQGPAAVEGAVGSHVRIVPGIGAMQAHHVGVIRAGAGGAVDYLRRLLLRQRRMLLRLMPSPPSFLILIRRRSDLHKQALRVPGHDPATTLRHPPPRRRDGPPRNRGEDEDADDDDAGGDNGGGAPSSPTSSRASAATTTPSSTTISTTMITTTTVPPDRGEEGRPRREVRRGTYR